MATIRELFHEIGNWHNKISVGAGVAKEMINQKLKNSHLSLELKEMLTKKLTELEQYAIGADKVLIQLKDIIYSIVNPDADNPKGGKSNGR